MEKYRPKFPEVKQNTQTTSHTDPRLASLVNETLKRGYKGDYDPEDLSTQALIRAADRVIKARREGKLPPLTKKSPK